jgi:hypothetical protein
MKSLFAVGLLSVGLLSMNGELTGSWKITGEVQGVPIDDACALVHADAKLTGSCMMGGKQYETIGSVDGKKVTLKHGGEYNGDPLTLTFTGVLADDGSIAGSIMVDPLNVDGSFSAKKAVAAK